MQVTPPALRSYRSLFLMRGIIGALFGVLTLSLSPAMTLLVLVYLFDGYALVGGIVAVALASRSPKEQGWALVLAEGLLGIVTGIMLIVGALTRLPGTGHKWLPGLGGPASVVFGILIALWPGAGLLTVIWLIGISAIVFGVMSIAAYFQSRALTSEPDLIGIEAGVVYGWSSHSLEVNGRQMGGMAWSLHPTAVAHRGLPRTSK